MFLESSKDWLNKTVKLWRLKSSKNIDHFFPKTDDRSPMNWYIMDRGYGSYHMITIFSKEITVVFDNLILYHI